MGIEAVKKVRIIAHQSVEQALINYLQSLNAVHITHVSKEPDRVVERSEGEKKLDERLQHLRIVLKFLVHYGEASKGLAAILGNRIIVSRRDFEDFHKEAELNEVIDQAIILEQEIHQAEITILNLENEIAALQPWEHLNEAPDALNRFYRVKVVTGTLPLEGFESVLQEIGSKTPLSHVEVLHKTKRLAYVCVLFHKRMEKTLTEILQKSSFEKVKLEGMILPVQQIEEKRTRIEGLHQKLSEFHKKARQLSGYLQDLRVLYDVWDEALKKSRVRYQFGATEYTILVEGWIPEKMIKKIHREMDSQFGMISLEEIEPEEGESPPILLKNRPLIRPFELITELYGMPHAKEFDPTPFFAPFFAIFFGLCLTDAGYGLVLLVLSVWMVKKYGILLKGSKLIWLLMIGGIFTIFMGGITGGWFGDMVDRLPAALDGVKHLKNAIMLFDPMKQSMIFFAIALVLGFIQICFGLGIKVVRDCLDRQFLDALFDPFAWLVLLNGAVLYGLGNAGRLSPAYGVFGKWLLIGAAAAIVLFSDREKKNPILRVVSGIYTLYGATSYLGDVLSYLRLLALGLATGVIAVVVNIIAFMVGGIPYVGWVCAIIILLGGHTFNIAINTLGAFVHTTRLQYVEFFPKFFEGGGVAFQPLKREGKYTLVTGQEKG